MFGSTTSLVWPDGHSEKAKLIPTGKSGGAGEIFAIEKKTNYVAKIYHSVTTKEQLDKYSKKIRWMVNNKPTLAETPADYNAIVQLAWPVAQVMQDTRFAGFVMEKIDFSRTLELDYLLTRRQAEEEGVQVDFGKLMTVSYNLASIINSLHSKKIAVVDLKPMNLKVYKSELYVSILDCDGFCIYSDTFRSDAPQVTQEYLAPEFHGKAVNDPESQDWFALATIIFRLLNYGIHPYVGISESRLKYPNELAARIKLGLYPYGIVAHKGIRTAPASVHESFPDNLRTLFDRAFGWAPGGRPSAYEWASTLGEYANRNSDQMILCANGHIQFFGKSCPTCLREGIIRTHTLEQTRFRTKIRMAPQKTLRHMQKSFNRTHTSPFQATLAQQLQAPSINIALTQPSRPNIPLHIAIMNEVSLEILWVLGMTIAFWWLK